MIQSLSDLDVYGLSYAFAMAVFQESRCFPREEKYSLADQIVRASRSVAANIAEGWEKRVYEQEFKKHLVYAMGSLEETKAWISFAKDCGYFSEATFVSLSQKCTEIGSKLYKLYQNWRTF